MHVNGDRPHTCSSEFFEAKYRGGKDPWGFATSPYETERYREIVLALAPGPYVRAFEPGCSIGVLTQQLAGLCDEIVATDIAPSAVQEARSRLSGRAGVDIQCVELSPKVLPEGPFDLIVLSEIGYYFGPTEWRGLLAALQRRLMPGGTLLAVHWLGQSPDHQQHGNEVHQMIHVLPELMHTFSMSSYCNDDQQYRLDRWEKR
jgi:cyclopropane fatty-acyl-phospholipid synthase-like methyltransferase